MTRYSIFTVNSKGSPVSNYCFTTSDSSVILHLIRYFKTARPKYRVSVTVERV